ncbi:type II toxin-antitoxin system RelE/ParE family toxin [Leifsonia sp. EB34]|uniref:type II toxin-antitoxin system RelE family toxin n=1 Tax=Leifsonia sp. EB34 TaxID=3156303 RepID=UPI003514324F
MTYTVEFTAASARELRKLDPVARNRVLAAVARLESDPRPGGARRLVGFTEAWRLRVGDYRVLYEVVDDTVLVTVFRVGHRRSVYAH